MKTHASRPLIQRASRAVRQLRETVGSGLHRAQLGPSIDDARQMVPSNSWHNHRAI